MSVITVTEENFDKEVIKSELPVLVDFWAPWCGPCKMMEPIFDEAAAKMSHQFKFCKVNIDENMNIAARFNISSIPTVALFEDGEIKNSHVGLMNEKKIEALAQSID